MTKFGNDPYIARTLTGILISKFLKLTLVHRIICVNMEESMHALKPLPKLGTAADPFRFMDTHCWDFTKQSSFFQ